jgi:hypothetical protein
MDKLWIKIALVAAFVIAMIFVFWGSWMALTDLPSLSVDVEKPPTPPPTLTVIPKPPTTASPADVKTYLDQEQAAVGVDKQAIDNYVQLVTAYSKDVDTRITVAKAKKGDVTSRLTIYEKVIKDTLGPLIVAPLLAALLVYSGLKLSADVKMRKAAGTREAADSP